MRRTLRPSKENIEERRRLHALWKSGSIGSRQLWEQALALDPDDFLALAGLAHEALSENNPRQARQLAWDAIRANPGFSPGYLTFVQAVGALGETELHASAHSLALRRALRDANNDVDLMRSCEVLVQALPEESRELWENDREELFEMLVLVTETPHRDEPQVVTDLLLPLRLIQKVLDPPSEGMTKPDVNRILVQAERCAPFLIGLLRGFVRNTLYPDRQFTAEASLGLLGAMKIPSTFHAVREFTTDPDDRIREIAVWAARQIAGKRQEFKQDLRRLPRVQEQNVYELCGESTEVQGETPVERLGRNDPCWCGSGKKYKQCHLNSDTKPESDPNANIVMRLMTFGAESCGYRDLKAAELLYFGRDIKEMPDEETQGFLTWLVSDFRPKAFRGNSIAVEYASRYTAILPEDEKRELQMLIGARYSLFEVESVDKGVSMQVRDCFLGDRVTIVDPISSDPVLVDDMMLCRLLQEDDHYVMAHPGDLVRLKHAMELKAWLMEQKASSDGDWHEFLRSHIPQVRQHYLEMLASS